MSAALKICAIAGSAVCLAAPLFLGCQPPWLSGFLLALVLTIGAAYLLVALCSGEGVRLPKGVVFFALLLMGWLTINAGRDFMLGVEGGRDPQASLRHLFYAAAFFCAAVLGAGTVRSPDQLKRLLVAVIVLGVLLSITSFAQYLGRDLKRPFGESFYGQRINGIYTNPNRFAVMLTITWLACVAVGGDALIRRSRLERTRLEMGLLIGCLLAIATAIVLTLSRLTMMSIAAWIGIVALWWVYLFRRYQDSATAFRNAMHLDHGGRTVIIALLLPLLCVGAWITFTLTLGSTELQRRLSFDPSVHSRFAVMELSLPLLTANPFWGVGLGGFESAFGVIQPVGFPGRWREVHNDWLQLGIEAGLPALILALCLFGAWFYACARRVRDEWRANQHTFALRVIALGAVTVPLMCSLGDFPLREPGTAVACFFLAGALCSTRLKYEAPVLRIALKPIVVVKSEAPVFTGRDSQLGPAVTEPSA
ncbi:MAG TPA: O-antigen ligase family protein, partial [Planctomycetota bacterium]|nr:O-antigen ligase family protein [Planctomycetota bacterium]